MSWDQALKIVSGIKHPVTAAAFAALIIGFVLWRAKKPSRNLVLALIVVGFVGVSPLFAQALVKMRGVYQIRVTVVGLDTQPVEDAVVACSAGGEPKKTITGWEFDVPPQTKPADGRIVLYASQRNAFLSGQTGLRLADDYFPEAVIQLVRDTSAMIRGRAVDERGKSVSGATVSVTGYGNQALTDSAGNFELPANAADGQIVQLYGEKGQLSGTLSAPAGKSPVELVLRRH